MTLRELNRLEASESEAVLLKCCGSTHWAQAMTGARPFNDTAALLEAADRFWETTGKEDRLEAFRHHPHIGEQGLREKFAATAAWASEEQKGVEGASEAVLRGLVEGNAEYDRKFGHVFLICATGKSAQEMLEALRTRLKNDAATELRIAAAEQAQITRRRLEKMIR